MSDYPMLISNKLHSFRNFKPANILKSDKTIYLCAIKEIKSRRDEIHINRRR